MAAVFAVGIPSAVASLLFDLDYIVIDRLIVSYHDLALAAIGIVLKVERFPLNVGIGICQGMMPLVAYSYAAGSHIRMKEIIRRSRGLGLLVAAVSITLYEIFAPQFVRIFISDAQTVEMASRFLRSGFWPPRSCSSAFLRFICFRLLAWEENPCSLASRGGWCLTFPCCFC